MTFGPNILEALKAGGKISVVPRTGKGVKAKVTFKNGRVVESGFNRGFDGLANSLAELNTLLAQK